MEALYAAAKIIGIDLRKRGGKAAFARKLDISRTAMGSLLEKDKRLQSKPSYKTAKKIHAMTGEQIEIDWLMGD